jgi:16S rRNA (uracil1498-N3)-methyltransferase
VRLYTNETLAAETVVPLAPGQAHHLRTVLRLAPGAVVAAFNPRDGEWLCRIAELDRGRGALTVERRLRPAETRDAPAADLWLVFAPIKRARLDWLVEKATELGVAALVPVWTRHTQSERLNLDRLYAHAVAAAEQCGRLSVPDLQAPQPLAAVLAGWPADRRLLVCDETGVGAPIAAATAQFGPGRAALLTGPEGGFAQTELDSLEKLPFVTRVGLGPLVLRADTAALAAVAAYQAIAGDWRRRGRR